MKLNKKEQALLVRLLKMTKKERKEWAKSEQPIKPGVNSARVLLALDELQGR